MEKLEKVGRHGREKLMPMFANRLLKNARHFGKWARRRHISCYRIYDWDLPEFPFVIDCYDLHIHLQEFETGYDMQPHLHALWLDEVKGIVGSVLNIQDKAIFCKWRPRHGNRAELSLDASASDRFVVTENGCRFWVDLSGKLDTGLFIDHRNTRSLVAKAAAGKRFLNLFAYTGSFTVYAAMAGAQSSLSVDLSHTYLDWARENMALNRIDPLPHQFLQVDILRWMDERSEMNHQFDVIMLDPPSFSNSKRMDRVLDIQADHVSLIQGCLSMLAPDGKLFFSTNLRRFRLDEKILSGCVLFEEITKQTIPEDCHRRAHRSWILTHRRG